MKIEEYNKVAHKELFIMKELFFRKTELIAAQTHMSKLELEINNTSKSSKILKDTYEQFQDTLSSTTTTSTLKQNAAWHHKAFLLSEACNKSVKALVDKMTPVAEECMTLQGNVKLLERTFQEQKKIQVAIKTVSRDHLEELENENVHVRTDGSK